MNNLPFRKRNLPQEKNPTQKVFFFFPEVFSSLFWGREKKKRKKKRILHSLRSFSPFNSQIFLYSPKDAGEMQSLLCNKNIQNANKPNSLVSVKSN